MDDESDESEEDNVTDVRTVIRRNAIRPEFLNSKNSPKCNDDSHRRCMQYYFSDMQRRGKC